VVVATGPAPKIDDTDPELAADPPMTMTFGPRMRRADPPMTMTRRVGRNGTVCPLEGRSRSSSGRGVLTHGTKVDR
jgi:hypothetical protein